MLTIVNNYMNIQLEIKDKNNNPINSILIKENNLYTKTGREKSILDIFLDNDIEIFYGCMGGSCGACICDIVEGEEYIDKEKIRTQVYKNVNQKEVLTCIAGFKENTPKNSKIVIKKKF